MFLLKKIFCFIIILVTLYSSMLYANSAELKQQVTNLVGNDFYGSKYALERERIFSSEKKEILQSMFRGLIPVETNVTYQVLLDILAQRLDDPKAFLEVEKRLSAAISHEVERRKTFKPMKVHAKQTRPDPMLNTWHCMPQKNIDEYIIADIDRCKESANIFSGIDPEIVWKQRAEFLRMSIWADDMPYLSPALLEIVIKGWKNSSEAKNLEKEGWGQDFYRNMAIYLIGELKYRPATEVLLAILYNPEEALYSRAHSLRALSKIADPKTIRSIIRTRCDVTVFPDEVKNKLSYTLEYFSPEDVVSQCIGDILDDKIDLKIRYVTLKALSETSLWEENEKYYSEIKKALTKVVENHKNDIQLRTLAEEVIKVILQSQQEDAGIDWDGYFKEQLLASDLDMMKMFNDVFNPDEQTAIETGKARIDKIYSRTISNLAGMYENGNLYLTQKYHNAAWPGTLENKDVKEYYTTMQKLKAGMGKEEVFKLLMITNEKKTGKPDKSIEMILKASVHTLTYTSKRSDLIMTGKSIGQNLTNLTVSKNLIKEVEGPYGIKTTKLKTVLVFENDKLIVIHSPRQSPSAD